jgi:hypothetical protein
MWLDKPAVDDSAPWVPVFRPRPGCTIEVILIGEARRLFTHYHSRRTFPCTQVHCPLCRLHCSKRVYAWYPAADTTGRIGLLELTALAEGSLLQQMEPVTDEPSGVARVTRPRGRRNQPLIVEWRRANLTDQSRHKRKDQSWTEEALLRLWNLPVPHGELCNGEWALHVAEIIESRIQQGSPAS